MAKITYNDKVALIVNPDIADENKVTDNDMNEIKQVVNENDDKFLTNGLNVSNEVDEDYRVNFVKSKNLFNGNAIYFGNATEINITNGKRITSTAAGFAFVLYKIKDVSNDVGKTYSIKANFSSGRIVIGLCDASGGNRITGTFAETGNTSINYTIPTLTTSKYLAIWLYSNTTETGTGTKDYTNIMLNEGNEALPYEPYVIPSIVVDNEEIYSKDNLEQYSTGEIRIGTWLGKPLYRKVIDCGMLPNATTKTISTGLSNVSAILKLYGTAYSGGTMLPIPHASAQNLTAAIAAFLTNSYGTLTIQTGSDRSTLKGYIVLEYTKTTD